MKSDLPLETSGSELPDSLDSGVLQVKGDLHREHEWPVKLSQVSRVSRVSGVLLLHTPYCSPSESILPDSPDSLDSNTFFSMKRELTQVKSDLPLETSASDLPDSLDSGLCLAHSGLGAVGIVSECADLTPGYTERSRRMDTLMRLGDGSEPSESGASCRLE